MAFGEVKYIIVSAAIVSTKIVSLTIYSVSGVFCRRVSCATAGKQAFIIIHRSTITFVKTAVDNLVDNLFIKSSVYILYLQGL